jgi:hypothetical protein
VSGYWVIAPFSNKRKEFKTVWAFDLEHRMISLGFTKIGNPSSLNERELRQLIDRRLKGNPERERDYYYRSLWNFYHSIKADDTIIARRGIQRMLAIGRVTRTAYYDRKGNPHARGDSGRKRNPYAKGDSGPYSHHIGVRWRPIGRTFDKPVFSQNAIYAIKEKKFCELTRRISVEESSDSSRSVEAQIVNSPKHHQLDYIFRSKPQIKQAEKDEERLVRDYRRWLERQERECRAARYGRLQCDVSEEQHRNLIEAKSSVRREYIRMAVGQLLDYAFHIGKKFPHPNLAILLPRKPDPDSIDWLPRLNISVIWREKGVFRDNANGKFSGKSGLRT